MCNPTGSCAPNYKPVWEHPNGPGVLCKVDQGNSYSHSYRASFFCSFCLGSSTSFMAFKANSAYCSPVPLVLLSIRPKSFGSLLGLTTSKKAPLSDAAVQLRRQFLFPNSSQGTSSKETKQTSLKRFQECKLLACGVLIKKQSL